MSLRINQETRIGLRELVRQWIIESRVQQDGDNLGPSTVEFSLLEAIAKENISAQRLDALNAITWYRIVSNAPEGGLGFRETEDTLTLLRLLKNIQEAQNGKEMTGEEIFLLLQDVITELHASMPIRRIDPPAREKALDHRQSVLVEHPPLLPVPKRQ